MLDGAVFDDAVMDNVHDGGPKEGPTARCERRHDGPPF
jgi:hypothetical protein